MKVLDVVYCYICITALKLGLIKASKNSSNAFVSILFWVYLTLCLEYRYRDCKVCFLGSRYRDQGFNLWSPGTGIARCVFYYPGIGTIGFFVGNTGTGTARYFLRAPITGFKTLFNRKLLVRQTISDGHESAIRVY